MKSSSEETDPQGANADPPVVYLAGPVAVPADGGARWRDAIIEEYGDEFAFRNPLSKYAVPVADLTIVEGVSDPETAETVGVAEIVEGDTDLLRESDGVLIGYSRVRSIGTPMEVMLASEWGLPIALWVRDDTDFDALSPWYRYHATALTTDPLMGLRHIENQYRDEGQEQP